MSSRLSRAALLCRRDCGGGNWQAILTPDRPRSTRAVVRAPARLTPPDREALSAVGGLLRCGHFAMRSWWLARVPMASATTSARGTRPARLRRFHPGGSFGAVHRRRSALPPRHPRAFAAAIAGKANGDRSRLRFSSRCARSRPARRSSPGAYGERHTVTLAEYLAARGGRSRRVSTRIRLAGALPLSPPRSTRGLGNPRRYRPHGAIYR